MRIALAAANMTREIDSRKNLITRIRRLALECQDCDVLVLPEYFAMLCLGYAPYDLNPMEEIPWLAHECEAMALEDEIAGICEQFGVAILAGTWPVKTSTGFRNRAHFITEDGVLRVQDKIALTDEEKDRFGWYLKPGLNLDVFAFQGVQCGISICHDTTSNREFEAFKAKDVKLVFVPSMCENEGSPKVVDSHSFIFDRARKRSEVCNCYFACVGSIGQQSYLDQKQDNVGGAALYNCGDMVAEVGPFEKGRGAIAQILKVDVDI
jgi:predicted amidohydrolase